MKASDNLISEGSIPGWLLESPGNSRIDNRRVNTAFIRKTLTEISRVVQNDFLTEKYAHRGGLLQGVHPCIKLVTILFYMVFSSLTHNILTLLFLSFVGGLMGVMSGLNLKSYIKRVWLILPLITLVLSVPAATNMIVKGNPILVIYHIPSFNALYPDFPGSLYFSFEGLSMILRMSLRIGVSVSFGYVLAMTTQWTSITRALRVFKVPRLVIMLLDMTYRFIFVLCKASIEIFEARLLRTVGRISGKENRKLVSGGIAHLFLKANHMGDELFCAMLCRGYHGEPVSFSYPSINRNDFLWIANNLLIALILLAGEFIYA